MLLVPPPRPPFLSWYIIPKYKVRKTGPLGFREAKSAASSILQNSARGRAEVTLQQNLIFVWSLPSSYPVFLTLSHTFSLERTPSKISPTRIPCSGLASRKPHLTFPCHLGSYLEATVSSNYTSRQAIPEVTEQKGLQAKLQYLNHTIYLINLKHGEKQETGKHT